MAVLLVGLCWWFWPRGDARFVGKWEVAGEHGVYRTWQFSSRGVINSVSIENEMYPGGRLPSSDRWWTKGDTLYFGSPHPAWLEWCFLKWDFRLFPPQESYRINWLDDDTVRLDMIDVDLMHVILTRLPE
ncbi:MAG TPA: hypothetical protein VM452_13670 [Caulifigura sp.]|nr:hypothetical protein [Caulifigura sp.]